MLYAICGVLAVLAAFAYGRGRYKAGYNQARLEQKLVSWANALKARPKTARINNVASIGANLRGIVFCLVCVLAIR